MVGIRLILVSFLIFFCAHFAEGVRDLEKEEPLEETTIEPEILKSIKQFEKEKEGIIKKQKLKKEIELPVFKPYAAPLSIPQPVATVSEKKNVRPFNPQHKKKNYIFDVTFFSIILALFFAVRALFKPTK